MIAATLENLHEPLHIKEHLKPEIEAGEVLIQLKAAALNHRDVWIQKGLYPGISTPIILGSDGSGEVILTHSEEDSHWLNKEVVINPGHNWGENTAFYGPDFKILGMPDSGTFAQYIKVPSRYLEEKPTHLTFKQAACLPLGLLTTWRALVTKGGIQAGQKVLITGIGGGVALIALQIALKFKAEVWVTSGSDEKIERAIKIGATGGINYRTPTWQKELLVKAKAPKLGYFDIIIDSAGGKDFSKLVDVAAPGGRICIFGGTQGTIQEIAPPKLFFKQLQILGTMMGTEAEFKEAIAFVNEHKIIPVIDSFYELRDINDAMTRMANGLQFGKIILTIPQNI